MANYIPEVAKILGVEIGEKFKTDKINLLFYFADDGLYDVNTQSKQKGILSSLLYGNQTIIKVLERPNQGDCFWYVSRKGKIFCELWEGTTFNLTLYKVGNVYKSYADAAANLDKWDKFYKSDRVMEV